jgi:hypothetical protein
MLPTVLLAARSQVRDELLSIIENRCHVISPQTLEEAETCLLPSRFSVALSDEDAYVTDIGWLLAHKIREQLGTPTKIVMLTNKPYNAYFKPSTTSLRENVDWILVFPISEEQILHEVERRSAS